MNTFPSDISNISDIEAKRIKLENLYQPARLEQAHWLRQVGQWLVKALTEADQPRIQIRTTRQGTLWHVQDPMNGTVQTFTSETSLRVWLEQRHNR